MSYGECLIFSYVVYGYISAKSVAKGTLFLKMFLKSKKSPNKSSFIKCETTEHTRNLSGINQNHVKIDQEMSSLLRLFISDSNFLWICLHQPGRQFG